MSAEVSASPRNGSPLRAVDTGGVSSLPCWTVAPGAVESPRDCRRLQWLRGWSHGQTDTVFPRGAGADGAARARPGARAWIAVGGHSIDRDEGGVHRRDDPPVGAAG